MGKEERSGAEKEERSGAEKEKEVVKEERSGVEKEVVATETALGNYIPQ